MAAARFPLIAIGLALTSGAIQSSSDLTGWLEFDVSASLHGEIWRPFTGHLCHFSQSHFVGDVAAFLIWAGAIELLSRRMLVAALTGTSLMLAAWLFSMGKTPLVYRGLSAVDCALAMQLFTVAFFSEQARRTAWLRVALVGIFVMLALKSGYEFATGRAILAPELGTKVHLLPAAHLLGLLVGFATAFWRERRARRVGMSRRTVPELLQAWRVITPRNLADRDARYVSAPTELTSQTSVSCPKSIKIYTAVPLTRFRRSSGAQAGSRLN